MMRRYKFAILIFILLFPVLGFSQKWKLSRSEYMYGIGISNYFGDIGGSSGSSFLGLADIDLLSTRPVLSVGYRYRLLDRVAIKANLTYANIHGTDVNSTNENRDYSFTTNMVELNANVEYHITEEKQLVSYSTMSLRGKLNSLNKGINLYVFAGVGGSYFKPKALDNFDGSDRYIGNKNLTVVFPVGIGFKYPISPKSFIGLEVGRRITPSDFIDGFDPEKSEYKDTYYFTVISVSYKIKRKSSGRPEIRF